MSDPAKLSAEELAADARKFAHQAVTEGVDLKYVERMRQKLYAAADTIESLTARLREAERVQLESEDELATELAEERLAHQQTIERLADCDDGFDLAAAAAERAEAERDACKAALTFYAEQRNYRLVAGDPACTEHGGTVCNLEHNDSWDGKGPGARARSALSSVHDQATAPCPACGCPETLHDKSLPGDPDGPMLICPVCPCGAVASPGFGSRWCAECGPYVADESDVDTR